MLEVVDASGTSACNVIAKDFVQKLPEQTLVVGVLNRDLGDGRGEYHDGTTTQAGELKDNFIVDYGDVFYTPSDGSGTTSFSAPRVSGKAALIKSKFPHLDGKGLFNRITSTADDLGAPGVDEIYGHGRINLSRALSPIGNLR